MSKDFLVCKDDIKKLLNNLTKELKLIIPVSTGKVIEFQQTDSFDINIIQNILKDENISYKSMKEFFFPQNELMFTFNNDDVSDNTDIPGYVIFGARPCDLEALRVLNTVYTTGKYKDTFFKKHLDANLVIGIGCRNQKPGCFCTEMGIDPEFSDFCDIMLVESGEDYSIVHLSDKGIEAIDKTGGQCRCLIENKTPTQSPCLKTQAQSPCLTLGSEREDSDYFDIIDWEKITKACKGCGICTYICPTCYCFDFKDTLEKGTAKRYKCWDSCMYPKFTLHASGHNPRDKRYERYRQRVLHKYKYVPDNFDGTVACTGCGRCIRSCPVGINIKNIVTQILNKVES